MPWLLAHAIAILLFITINAAAAWIDPTRGNPPVRPSPGFEAIDFSSIEPVISVLVYEWMPRRWRQSV